MNDISWDGNRGVKISWKHRKSFTKKKKKMVVPCARGKATSFL